MVYHFQVAPSSRHKASLSLEKINSRYLQASRGTTSLMSIVSSASVKKESSFQWIASKILKPIVLPSQRAGRIKIKGWRGEA